MIITTVGSDGKTRPHACIPVSILPMWLMNVHVNKVSADLRDKSKRFPLEAVDVLDRHFSNKQPTLTRARVLQQVANASVEHEDQLVDHSDQLAQFRVDQDALYENLEKRL